MRPTLLLAAILLATLPRSAGASPYAAPAAFRDARPVWPEGRETERNLLVEFRAGFDRPAAGPVIARLAAASLYRFFVNDRLAGHGPARAGHGVYRVDEWDVTRHLRDGRNTLRVEVAGYNANSYSLLDQPSFLQAEVLAADTVLAATGSRGFDARIRGDRVQKVQRYSFQRPFSEVWHLPGPAPQPAPCAVAPAKTLAPRHVPYPTLELRRPTSHVAEGEIERCPPPAKPWKDRSLTGIGPDLGGYPEADLATIPSIELQGVKNRSSRAASSSMPFPLKAASYRTLDFGVNRTGFIGLDVAARSRTRLFATFDEILSDGDVNFRRLGCVNVVLLELEPGTHRFESFEPYTLRYLKLVALEGECEVRDCALRELVNPDASRARFSASDPRFDRIFEAARETFRQNATDLFMDCPSRERAGWLCDSYFTARVALDLCGDTVVERNFLENFLHPPSFAPLPEGMLPMCYPADHPNGRFIPNWAMWFVLQLEEYAARDGDPALVAALRPRVLRLLEFLAGFENADGLLEKLPSWVFVEWSKANSFVQDVNYPSNMLYAGTLDAAARLYALPDLAARAGRVRETIRRQSFDGRFFVDNATRAGRELRVTRNRTEVCQYFALFFDVASPESHPDLWRALVTDFGPRRKETGAHPEIHPANAFIGNQLRFELLSRHGRNRQILDEAIGYWLYMADRTGTLWEHDAPQASCNHGFASHAAHVLIRDVLGLHRLDTRHRSIRLRFADIDLAWCKGSIPTPHGPVDLAWRKPGDGTFAYRVSAPPGYAIDVENRTGARLVKE